MENDQSSTSVSPLALGGAITGIFVLIFSVIYLFFRSSKTDETKSENEIKSENDVKKQPTKSTTSKSVKQDNTKTTTATKFVHPWLCASLRAHSSSINGLDFSNNDKFLASAAEGNFIIFCFFYLLIYLSR